MQLKSISYSNNQNIPVKYCRQTVTGGQNISPRYSWEDVPAGTQSFILMMVDHHPIASNWVHWLIVDIPSNINSIPEGASKTFNIPVKSIELINTFGLKGYDGPQPPKGSGKHNYDTILYALDIEHTGLTGEISESELLKKIKPHILDQAILTGFFER